MKRFRRFTYTITVRLLRLHLRCFVLHLYTVIRWSTLLTQMDMHQVIDCIHESTRRLAHRRIPEGVCMRLPK